MGNVKEWAPLNLVLLTLSVQSHESRPPNNKDWLKKHGDKGRTNKQKIMRLIIKSSELATLQLLYRIGMNYKFS